MTAVASNGRAPGSCRTAYRLPPTALCLPQACASHCSASDPDATMVSSRSEPVEMMAVLELAEMMVEPELAEMMVEMIIPLAFRFYYLMVTIT